MITPNKKELAGLRAMHPPGTRVELVQMDDVQAPPIGTRGTVVGVDDTGSLLMHWDNGSSLNVLWKVDKVRVLEKATFIVDNIQWDVDDDDEDLSLPKRVCIEEDDISEADIADWLSDHYGFCVKSFVLSDNN
jgi:hypothetical protein